MKKERNAEQSGGLLNWSDLKLVSGKFIYWSMFTILMLISLICLIPVVWMFISGFKTPEELYAVPPKLFPSHFDFNQLIDIWTVSHIDKYIFNTLWIIIGCLIFDIFFNGIAGYALSRIKPKGSKFVETALFWTMMLPGISMVPLYMTFVKLPVLNISLMGTFLPMWIMSATGTFHIFLFRNFFNGIPKDYIEAARIDGATNIKIFFSIMIPLAAPIITVVTIFSVIGSWSNFFWPYLILGNTDREPLSVMLYNLTSGRYNFLANQEMLIMMIAAIPPIVIYAIFSKKILGGVNIGGIKG